LLYEQDKSCRVGLKAVLSIRGIGRGQGSSVLNRGRGRDLEARQTKFEARPRRGDPLKNLPLYCRCIAVPNLVALRLVKLYDRGLNGLVAVPFWVEVIYVIPLYGV